MGKLLIIDKGVIRELTFEEVLEMYRPLVMREIYNFKNLKMEFDDKYQLVTIGLWDAYENFDVTKNIGFGWLAKINIENRLKRAIEYNNRSKRSGIAVVSIDRTLKGKHDEDESIMDLLSSDDDVEGNVIARTNLNKFVSILTDKQKEVVNLYMRGLYQKEICDILGVGQSAISMRMIAARKKFNECMFG